MNRASYLVYINGVKLVKNLAESMMEATELDLLGYNGYYCNLEFYLLIAKMVREACEIGQSRVRGSNRHPDGEMLISILTQNLRRLEQVASGQSSHRVYRNLRAYLQYIRYLKTKTAHTWYQALLPRNRFEVIE
jgi:hypothetical protein